MCFYFHFWNVSPPECYFLSWWFAFSRRKLRRTSTPIVEGIKKTPSRSEISEKGYSRTMLAISDFQHLILISVIPAGNEFVQKYHREPLFLCVCVCDIVYFFHSFAKLNLSRECLDALKFDSTSREGSIDYTSSAQKAAVDTIIHI